MKKLIAFFLALCMTLSLVACGQEAKPQANPSGAAAATNYPIQVTDQAGRTVTIEQEPQRIVSAYYISSSLLIALDLEDRMVGIENKPEKRAIYSLSAPQLCSLPQIGTVKELDIEAVVALEPDLLILPMKQKNNVATLEGLGLTVLLVDPEDQARLNGMIQLIGQAANKNERAEALLDWISGQQAFLTETLKGVEAPSVYLAGNSSMLKTAGNGMYQAEMIRLAGGSNVAGAIEDTYWVEIDYEQLLVWNPEYIILASDADYTVEDVLKDPNLAACTAVVKGNVYRMPNQAEAWDSPVPSSVLGSLWLANILHPDKLSEAENIARMNEFYEKFYQFTYIKN